MTAPAAANRTRRFAFLQLGLAVGVVTFPWLPFVPYSILGRANLAAQYALIAVSLVVLTGWVGQVSLGQAAFVGVGAYVTGIAQGAWHVGFPLNLVAGAGAGALTASLLGVVALRVRGLYLAVATLIFSWTADAFLFQQHWLTKHASIALNRIGKPHEIPSLDFTSRRTFYYAAWATVALAIFMMSNLRDRKIGRAFFAIRGSEMAAASLGIDVVRTKLTAFAISGALAGVAGSLTLVGAQVVTTDQFNLGQSLFFLAVAVVGGLTSLAGAVAAGALFAGLEEVFFRYPSIGHYLTLVSAVLLAVVLLTYPGGLAALGRAATRRGRALYARLRDRLEPDDASELEPPAPRPRPEWLERVLEPLRRPLDRYRASAQARRQVRTAATSLDLSRVHGAHTHTDEVDLETVELPAAPMDGQSEAAPGRTSMVWGTMDIPEPDLPADRSSRRPLIEAERVTVRFGGLTAVADVSLTVRQGEIVGLIGPNGAGKTTTFNSIAGFNTPTDGRIRIHGIDCTNFPVYLRSRLGVARTFQVIQLFPQLDVFDNLLVATYVSDRSGLFASMLVSNRSLREELEARRRVQEVIELIGLGDVTHRTVSELPFGVLRMVEIARALVTGAPVMMLDEPASGLDDVETQRLSTLIRFIRSLGVTILLIEHDVHMVTSISDYMYVLDQGSLIAEGTPEEIQRDPHVIAAYLGEPADDTEGVDTPEPAAVR